MSSAQREGIVKVVLEEPRTGEQISADAEAGASVDAFLSDLEV